MAKNTAGLHADCSSAADVGNRGRRLAKSPRIYGLGGWDRQASMDSGSDAMQRLLAWNVGLVVLALAAEVALGAHSVLACPFCGTGSQTFTEEIATMDV